MDGQNRALYHDYAWAYEALVAPTGPQPQALPRLLAASGIQPGAAVVDAGCGAGAGARRLAEAGYRVVGIDRSPELIAVARERAGSARVEVGDLLTWRPDQPADAVVCRGVLNDFLNDEERGAALRSLAEMLRSAGRLLVDVRDWDAAVERYAEPRVYERSSAGLAFRSETSLDRPRRRLLVRERIVDGARKVEHDFAMRCWTREELDGGLRRAGFAAHELIDPASSGARADRLVALATR